MIKQIYKKIKMKVEEDYIVRIMADKERVKDFMRLYENEKIDSMNYIFGKPYDNKYFTNFELEAVSKIDLFNRKVVEVCRKIYDKEIKEGVKNA